MSNGASAGRCLSECHACLGKLQQFALLIECLGGVSCHRGELCDFVQIGLVPVKSVTYVGQQCRGFVYICSVAIVSEVTLP